MLRRWLASILVRIRPKPAEPFHVAYEPGACTGCGERSAVLDGKCWYCRTGNVPVKEPMTWSPDE